MIMMVLFQVPSQGQLLRGERELLLHEQHHLSGHTWRGVYDVLPCCYLSKSMRPFLTEFFMKRPVLRKHTAKGIDSA